MATITVSLIHGYKVGKDILKEAVLREATAGDVIEASEESEKLVVLTNADGKPEPQFVPSPTLVGVNVLRRQIARIGNVNGPFELSWLKTLHPEDLNLLQAEADKLDSATETEAAPKAVAQGGRSDSNSEAD